MTSQEEFPAGSTARLFRVMNLLQQAIDDFFGDANCDYTIQLLIDSNGAGCFIIQHARGPLLRTDGLNDDFEVNANGPDDVLASLLAGAINETRLKMNLPL